MTNRPSLGTSLLVGLIALLLAAPASALAADIYVDQAKGNDANTCLTPLDACEHIVQGINNSGPGDAIHVADPVAPTTYDEQVYLSEGRSLVAEAANPAETILGTASTPYAVIVDGNGGAGTITGFTIRAKEQPVRLNGPAVVDGNTFDQPNPPTAAFHADVVVGPGADDAKITDNTFSDAVQDAQTAIIASSASPLIEGNRIDGFNVGVGVFGGGNSRVVDNEISGVHPVGSIGTGITVGNQQARVSRGPS